MGRRLRQFGIILIPWTSFGAFYGWEVHLFNLHAHHSLALHTALLQVLPDYWLYAALTPAALAFSRRHRFRKDKWLGLVGIHFLGALAFLLLWSMLKVVFYPVLDISTGVILARGGQLLRWLIIENAHDAFWFYGTIVAASELLHYQAKSRERERRAAVLETQLAQAQLTVLKMQLDPHFLFNTLHAISSLMHEDAAAADKTVSQLGDLLRMSFENGNSQEVTLERELEFLRGYLEIQKTRLRERLNVRLNLDPRALDALVPNMILQPLVENAVRYGIASRSTPGHLEIRAEERGSVLCLEITDDGPGINSQRLTPPTGGVGLANTRARLQQLYGGAHRFSLIDPPGGGTQVRLEIPFRLRNCETPNERLHAH